jgi:N-acetylglucosaminyl-diphospho-decaprenol L-rhamnosyltransferase
MRRGSGAGRADALLGSPPGSPGAAQDAPAAAPPAAASAAGPAMPSPGRAVAPVLDAPRGGRAVSTATAFYARPPGARERTGRGFMSPTSSPAVAGFDEKPESHRDRLSRVDLIVLVHRDAPNVVVRSLRALAVSMGTSWSGRVVFVQNGSPAATAMAARCAIVRSFPSARIVSVSSRRNLGFAAGVNLGVAHAAAPYVGLFNPDGITRPETVARLAGVLDRDRDVFMAGARLVSTAVPEEPPACAPRQVDWLPGTAMLFRREWFLEIGGFDPGFFMYCEDVDLSRRARAREWTLAVAPDAVFVHARAFGRLESLRRIRMWTVSNTSLVYQYGAPRWRAMARLAAQRAEWCLTLARRRRLWTLAGALIGSAAWPVSIPRLEHRRRHPWDGAALSHWLAKTIHRVHVDDVR